MEGRGLGSRAAHDGGRDVGTGENLTASEKVQRLQTALHAKAKEAPGFRFYSLSDKVWRGGRARGRLAGRPSQRRRGRGGRRNGRRHRVAGGGPVAGSTGAGPESGNLPAAGGSAGSHPEEATWDSSGRWAFRASGTGWRRRRRCWCCRRSSKPTCNRSSMRTGRAETRMTRSGAYIGC